MPGRGRKFEAGHKKAPEKVLFYAFFNKLALLLQFFLSEEIGKQCGA